MKISKIIQNIAKENNIFIKTLSIEYTKKLKTDITKKYLYKYKDYFLWESFKEFSAKQDVDGWEKISNFIGNEKSLMFFDSREDNSLIIINNGKDLYEILAKTFHFEFYITNFETDYLICFNHHDILLGCGTAKKWIELL